MKEIAITIENLTLFLNNIRLKDKAELKFFLGPEYKKKFVDFILRNQDDVYFLSYNNYPSCIGGAYKDEIGAQIWLLCTDQYYKKFLLRYLINKIIFFKKKYKYLYNFIYRSNFKFLKFLKKQGFKVKDTKNKNVKFFYYNRRNSCDF